MVIIELYFQQNYDCSAKSVPYAMFSASSQLSRDGVPGDLRIAISLTCHDASAVNSKCYHI